MKIARRFKKECKSPGLLLRKSNQVYENSVEIGKIDTEEYYFINY